MKKTALLFMCMIILGLTSTLSAQWVKTFGGILNDHPYDIKATSDGGLIVLGLTYSFGAGSSDIWVLKLDENGTRQWERTIGGVEGEFGKSIAQTADGGFIIGATTFSYGSGDHDILVIKLFPDGNTDWVRTYGGVGRDEISSINKTTDANYILAGTTSSFDVQNSHPWFLLIDSEGIPIWQKAFIGNTEGYGHSAIQTLDGGFVLAGSSYQSSPGAVPKNWIIKVNHEGNRLWENTYGDSYSSVIDVVQTPAGELVVATEGPQLLKLSSTGEILPDCEFHISSTLASYSKINSLKQTRDGGFIIAGYANSATPEGNKIIIIKLSANIQIQWQKTFDIQLHDEAYSISERANGGYFVAASSIASLSDSVDFLVLRLASNGDIGGTCEYLVNLDYSASAISISATESFLDFIDTSSSPAQQSDVPNVETFIEGNLLCQGSIAEPYIELITPASGIEGTHVVIAGNNLGATPGRIEFNGVVATEVTYWTTDRVDCIVPLVNSTGSIPVIVYTADSRQSNLYPFMLSIVAAPPVISTLSPDFGPPGEEITINGQNFGTTAGFVRLNGAPAQLSDWSDSQIVAVVPSLAGDGLGPVTVETSDGRLSNEVIFLVTKWTEVDLGFWDQECDDYFASIAIHPTEPDTIYIGNGHPEKGCGIYKSTDGGHSWIAKNDGLSKAPLRLTESYPQVVRIVIAPSDKCVLYASLGDGIYRSINGGDTWAKVNGSKKAKIKGLALDLAVSYQDPNTVYAVTSGGGVFKTNNGGTAWECIEKAARTFGSYDVFETAGIAPSDSNVLYVAGFTNYGDNIKSCGFTNCVGYEGVMPFPPLITTDGGASSLVAISNPFFWLMPSLVNNLLVNPYDPMRVYASTIAYAAPLGGVGFNRGIFRSNDGGISWNPINYSQYTDLSQLPIYELLPHTSSGIFHLYAVAGFEGIYRSSNDGDFWKKVTDYGIPTSTFTRTVGISDERLVALTTKGVFIISMQR